MATTHTPTIIHHLYSRPSDLLPLCGVIPGPGDPGLGESHFWHTGHDATLLKAHYDIGNDCCTPCLEHAVADLPADPAEG